MNRTETDPGTFETAAGGWADRAAVEVLVGALDVPELYRAQLVDLVLSDPRATAAARTFADIRHRLRAVVLETLEGGL